MERKNKIILKLLNPVVSPTKIRFTLFPVKEGRIKGGLVSFQTGVSKAIAVKTPLLAKAGVDSTSSDMNRMFHGLREILNAE